LKAAKVIPFTTLATPLCAVAILSLISVLL
jgi:hypothetical protein